MMPRSTSQMFPRVLETPLQFIFVTSLSSVILTICGCCWWLLQNLEERKVISLTDCKLKCFSSRIYPPPSPPYIGPPNLRFVRIFAQGVLKRFYGIMKRRLNVLQTNFLESGKESLPATNWRSKPGQKKCSSLEFMEELI